MMQKHGNERLRRLETISWPLRLSHKSRTERFEVELDAPGNYLANHLFLHEIMRIDGARELTRKEKLKRNLKRKSDRTETKKTSLYLSFIVPNFLLFSISCLSSSVFGLRQIQFYDVGS